MKTLIIVVACLLGGCASMDQEQTAGFHRLLQAISDANTDYRLNNIEIQQQRTYRW